MVVVVTRAAAVAVIVVVCCLVGAYVVANEFGRSLVVYALVMVSVFASWRCIAGSGQ